MEYRFDGALRSRCESNLRKFPVVSAEATDELRHAAVAVCIVPGRGGEACLIITRRSSRLRTHSGQLALPGGRVDPGEDAFAAALRETEEEVGLVCGRDAILGRLDDFDSRSGHRITPVVVWGPEAGDLVLRAGEVESVFLLPLAQLDHPDAPRFISIPESDRPVIQMPIFGDWIHAPTAAVIYQFREVALHGRHTRVAHFEQPTWAWR